MVITRERTASDVSTNPKNATVEKVKKTSKTASKTETVNLPTTLCGSCKEEIVEEPETHLEKSMECECCMKWYHTQCGKLSEMKFNAITDLELTWYCPSCEGGAKRLKQHILNLETEHNTFKQELQELRTKVEKTENNIENINTNLDEKIDARIDAKLLQIRAQVEQAKPTVAPPTSPATARANLETVVNETMKEKEEILKRKLHLMLHCLDEPTGQETEDGLLKTLIKDKLQITEEITIEEITRLGDPRDDDKPWLLKIKLESLAMKRKVLSRATQLRQLPETDRFHKVYIRPDLTQKQQRDSKNLNDQLKAKRNADPDNNNQWVIYRGKIVKRR